MKKVAVFLVTMSTMLVVNAQAVDKQSSWYTEGALDMQSWGAFSSGEPAVSPKSLRMVVGKRIMPSVSIEATAGFGFGGDGSPGTRETNIKSVLGLYGKYTYELMPKLDIYGRVGFTMTTSETKSGGINPDTGQPYTNSSSQKASGLSFGFGASYDITDKYYVGADYTFHPKAPQHSFIGEPGKVSAITFFGGMRY
jgi:opacity protein-like surface antigen